VQSRRPVRAFGFFVARRRCIMGNAPPPLAPPARGGEFVVMTSSFLPLDGGGEVGVTHHARERVDNGDGSI
jgi:hypothetical protein